MKEKIYTIPVNEAFQEKSACPFCSMHQKLNHNAIEYMLGPSYMEDDIRMETNRMGFCQNHYQKLFDGQNRLGLALMMHTHLQQINTDLQRLTKGIGMQEKKKLFAPRNTSGKDGDETAQLLSYLQTVESACYICNKVNATLERYVDTFFYMWKNDGDMKSKVKESNGFCLHHFGILLAEGKRKLNFEAYKEFLSIVLPIETDALHTLADDLDWFIQKFDYRNNEAPWKNAKDALPRAMNKIASIYEEVE